MKPRTLIYFWALAFTLGIFAAFITSCRSDDKGQMRDDDLRPALLRDAF